VLLLTALRDRDTLKRHVSTHGAAAMAVWTDQEPRDHRRACEACARGKQRCDGDGAGSAPCSKCASKGRQCVYPDSSARGHNADAESETVDNDVPDDSAEVDESLHNQVPDPFNTQDLHAISTGEGGVESMQYDPSDVTAAVPTANDMFSVQLDYGFLWDDPLVSPQFMFPFSPPHSLGARGPENSCFELQQECAHHDHNLPVDERLTEMLPESDHLTAEEEDILVAEYVPHVPPLGIEMRAHIVNMLKNELQSAQAEDLDRRFPTSRHLDTYVQLYFEHFHHRMPILHVPTFRTSSKVWLLVLAIVCIGCDYSKASLKSDHRGYLQTIARQMLKTDVSLDHRCSSHITVIDKLWHMQITRYRDVDVLTRAQALLLFQQVCLSMGHRDALVGVQLHRNVLVTLCRQFISQDGNPLHNHLIPETTNHGWLQWVGSEARHRLVYFTWRK
jgi:hypothetical protein